MSTTPSASATPGANDAPSAVGEPQNPLDPFVLDEERIASLLASKRELFRNVVHEDATEDVVGVSKKMVEMAVESLTGDGAPAPDPADRPSTDEPIAAPDPAPADPEAPVPVAVVDRRSWAALARLGAASPTGRGQVVLERAQAPVRRVSRARRRLEAAELLASEGHGDEAVRLATSAILVAAADRARGSGSRRRAVAGLRAHLRGRSPRRPQHSRKEASTPSSRQLRSSVRLRLSTRSRRRVREAAVAGPSRRP